MQRGENGVARSTLLRQLSVRRQPFARRQIHLRQLQPLLSPVGRNESVSENARGSPLSALSSRVQSGEVVPIRGRRSRPDWPSYLEVTISASDSRNVRDPSAPRAIRNKQQASPTQSALSRPLKNCSKKPDSALLRNLMDEFDVASTQSPSSDEGVEVPANPPPPQTSSAFQAASSAGGKPAIAEPQDALKTLGEGATDTRAQTSAQTRADAHPPERHTMQQSFGGITSGGKTLMIMLLSLAHRHH